MVTKARNFGAGGFTGLQHCGASGNFDFDAIDGQFRHGSADPDGGAKGQSVELAGGHGIIQLWSCPTVKPVHRGGYSEANAGWKGNNDGSAV
jgi:hypothetical protein